MTKSYTLVISEKPQSALRIADALADNGVKKIINKGSYWLEFTRNNKKYIVAPAVGHLFVLDTIKGEGWVYPTFNVEWVPTFTKKGTEFTKRYYDNIKKLVKDADDFIVATDFDTEGEVIGFNILRFLCKRENAKRMKFSTLTKYDLVEAYENMMNHIDLGHAEAGLTRHYLDFHWGINMTRALTLALKHHLKKGFIVVSSGRVQSPTLKILNDRYLEIKKFKPVPFWQVELYCLINGNVIIAIYEDTKIWKKQEAEKVYNDCKGKDATVKDIEKSEKKVPPPIPFDTTGLQIEAYKCFGFSPTQTMSIAESLYNQALISYPRTSSQKLPSKIGYNKILQGLMNIKEFKEICSELLSKELKPREGKKVDPAHVAIYPTGEVPRSLTNQQFKIYKLIVKRFFSVFGKSAVRELLKVILDVNGHNFIAHGIRTLKPGWLKYYSEFAKMKEQVLPELKKGQVLTVKELKMFDKETQPPNHYTQGSIIHEMEKRGLGTKATRAQILKTLYDRGYIKGRSIEVTEFGGKVVEVLIEYCPKIVSEELTKKFEEDMELVIEQKRKKEKIIGDAKKLLTEILTDFKENEEKVGESLSKAYIAQKKHQKLIGKCPECEHDLKIIVSRRTGKRFVGCTNYKNGCRFSTPLPQTGFIKGLNKNCKICGFPLIAVKFKRKWYESCTNMKCPSKEQNNKKD